MSGKCENCGQNCLECFCSIEKNPKKLRKIAVWISTKESFPEKSYVKNWLAIHEDYGIGILSYSHCDVWEFWTFWDNENSWSCQGVTHWMRDNIE